MKNKLLSTCRLSGLLVVQLICAVLAGLLLLTAAYAIPTKRIDRNVRISAEKIADEGTYPKLFGWCSSQLDNWTDSIMLLGAAHSDDDSALTNAMQSEYGRIDGVNPYVSMINHYTQGRRFSYDISYNRYWHGYMVFLKPLLFITDYQNIRSINGILQGVLLSILIMLMIYKNAKQCILPTLISYALLIPIALAQSLQFSTCFYISLMGSIALFLLKDKVSKQPVFLSLFLWLGISTAFFDFLTYPIITYCIPITLYLCLFDQPTTFPSSLLTLIKTGSCWIFGYAGMWASKWVVGSIVLDENLIKSAMKQAETRSSFGDAGETTLDYIVDAISINVRMFFDNPLQFIALIFVIAILIYLVVKLARKQLTITGRIWSLVFSHITIALLPFAWYFCMSNHSYVHCWFTNKALAGTVFAGMTLLVRILPLAKQQPPEKSRQ